LGVAIVFLSLLIRVLEIRDGKIRARKKEGSSDNEAPSITATEPENVADGAILEALKGEGVNAVYP
jgi:hypothetical protein